MLVFKLERERPAYVVHMNTLYYIKVRIWNFPLALYEDQSHTLLYCIAIAILQMHGYSIQQDLL